VICPNPECKFKNLEGEKYCSECGTALIPGPKPGNADSTIKCRKCGFETKANKKYCSECGTSLGPTGTDPNYTPAGTNSAMVSDTPPVLLPPNTILQTRYRITKLIGQGGMGAIYQADDTRFSNRLCVVKEMLDHFADPEQRNLATQNFHREADMLSSLRHAGIPEVYDRFTEGNRHYLVMEFIDGQDIEQMLLQQDEPLKESEVLNWATQICDLLSYLHHQKPGIIYRDMKPANLMLTPGGRIYLIDFGIARHFNPVSKGTMIGTQGYAPPEQYRGQVEPKSDIYALGATMHHLLTNRDPQSEAPFSFPPVRQLNKKISIETEKIIMKSLEMDLNNRFKTADEMLEVIMKVGRGSGAVKLCPHCKERVSITKQFCPYCEKYIAAHTGAILTEQDEPISGLTAIFSDTLRLPKKYLNSELLLRIILIFGFFIIILLVVIIYIMPKGN